MLSSTVPSPFHQMTWTFLLPQPRADIDARLFNVSEKTDYAGDHLWHSLHQHLSRLKSRPRVVESVFRYLWNEFEPQY
jgi:hypothetical protein